MSEWLYYLKPTRLGMVTEGATLEEAEIVGRHFAYLKNLTEKGVMILMGRIIASGLSHQCHFIRI